MNGQRTLLLPLGLALLTVGAQADVYKCRLPDGRIEYSNTGCEKSNTLTVRPDDNVSPETRAEAERNVERMRDYVREREAANRQPQPNSPPAGNASANAPTAPSPAAIDECLRDLERQAMDAGQRAAREAACQSAGRAQPSDDGLPVYVVGNSVSRCIRNVERRQLSPTERARQIDRCQGIYYPPPPPPSPRPSSEPPAGKTVIVPGSLITPCPSGQKNCQR